MRYRSTLPPCSEQEASANNAILTEHRAAYAGLQRALVEAGRTRRAGLAARRARELREELVGGDGPGALSAALRARGRLETSKGITRGLRRARQALAEELQHTGATLHALDASQQQLQETRDEYYGQAPLLQRAGRLLRHINWQANMVSGPSLGIACDQWQDRFVDLCCLMYIV